MIVLFAAPDAFLMSSFDFYVILTNFIGFVKINEIKILFIHLYFGKKRFVFFSPSLSLLQGIHFQYWCIWGTTVGEQQKIVTGVMIIALTEDLHRRQSEWIH